MKMTKAKFIPAAPDEFDVDLELMRKAKKNGWLEEVEFIIEKLKDAPVGQPFEIVPDFR